MSIVELCRQLTAIDSSVSHGTRDIATFIGEQASQWGLNVDIQTESVNGIVNANVLVRPSSASENLSNLLLVSRMDTVDPGDYGYWVRTGANPFNASVDGEHMYGLGLADAKADLACKLVALREAQKSQFTKLYPAILGTFGLGSSSGAIRFIRKKALKLEAALVSAPTKLQVANKGPGYAKVEIAIPFSETEQSFREKHDLSEASVSQSKMFTRKTNGVIATDFNDNPLIKLIDYLKNIPSGMSIIGIEGGVNFETEPDSAFLELDLIDTVSTGVGAKLITIGESLKKLSLELKSVHDNQFEPPYSTITLGMARTYPEEIRLSGVCHLVPAEGRNVYENWLESLRQDCISTGASFRILDYRPPFVSRSDGAFMNDLKNVSSELGLQKEQIAANRSTEANVFQRLGVESAVFGPGDLKSLKHASHEHVSSNELQLAVNFYKKLIERMCI